MNWLAINWIQCALECSNDFVSVDHGHRSSDGCSRIAVHIKVPAVDGKSCNHQDLLKAEAVTESPWKWPKLAKKDEARRTEYAVVEKPLDNPQKI